MTDSKLSKKWMAMTSISIALVASAIGCSAGGDAPSPNEPVSSEGEALSEKGCTTATADATMVGGATYISRSTYSNASCFKAVVVDIDNYDPSFPGATGASFNIGWAGPSYCQSGFIRAILYEREPNGAVYQIDDQRSDWGNSGDLCVTPAIAFRGMVAGHNYRVAATARSSSGSTQPLRVSLDPVWPIK